MFGQTNAEFGKQEFHRKLNETKIASIAVSVYSEVRSGISALYINITEYDDCISYELQTAAYRGQRT
jgi:hypothetical protein